MLDVTGPHSLVHNAERGRAGGTPTRPAEMLKGREAETFGYSKKRQKAIFKEVSLLLEGRKALVSVRPELPAPSS